MNQENSKKEKKANKESPREREQPSQSSLLIIRQYARSCRPIKYRPLGNDLILPNETTDDK
ncbi:MAG TPA: hypothetical protein DEQ06_06920 [Porphyromonadaceae bacterium]|nr:hypothetical protein [Porphyromonadaceae bacterium]